MQLRHQHLIRSRHTPKIIDGDVLEIYSIPVAASFRVGLVTPQVDATFGRLDDHLFLRRQLFLRLLLRHGLGITVIFVVILLRITEVVILLLTTSTSVIGGISGTCFIACVAITSLAAAISILIATIAVSGTIAFAGIALLALGFHLRLRLWLRLRRRRLAKVYHVHRH